MLESLAMTRKQRAETPGDQLLSGDAADNNSVCPSAANSRNIIALGLYRFHYKPPRRTTGIDDGRP